MKEEKASILHTTEEKESIKNSLQETVDVFIKGIRAKNHPSSAGLVER
jgi:hypothetical protein